MTTYISNYTKNQTFVNCLLPRPNIIAFYLAGIVDLTVFFAPTSHNYFRKIFGQFFLNIGFLVVVFGHLYLFSIKFDYYGYI